MLSQLDILRDLLEKKLHDPEEPVNPVLTNSVLTEISNKLNASSVNAKYDVAREEES